jgi:hypothetical protein
LPIFWGLASSQPAGAREPAQLVRWFVIAAGAMAIIYAQRHWL